MNKPRENNIACCAFLFVFLCSSSSFHDASFFFSSFLLFLLTFLYVSISQPLFHRRSPFFFFLRFFVCIAPLLAKNSSLFPRYTFISRSSFYSLEFSLKKKKSIRKIIFLRRLKERRLISRVRKFFQFHHAWW